MAVGIVRGSITRKDSWMDFVSILERSAYNVGKSKNYNKHMRDKYRTALRLADYGLTQLKTKLINSAKNLMNK